METKRPVEDGLNLISETVRTGPFGGVVCLTVWVMSRRLLSKGARPRVASTEKQATPALAPPLRTQAVAI